MSNTPTEAVFDDDPRRDSLNFSVHLWNPAGSEPTTMAEVFNRHKDVQYSSRIASRSHAKREAPGLNDPGIASSIRGGQADDKVIPPSGQVLI